MEEDDAVMDFHFPTPPAGGHSVVKLEKVSKNYGPISILDNFDFEIVKGDRIAIVGVNGAGKSTFSRLVSGGEEPTAGRVTMGHHTRIAFFSQTHADDLNPDKTVLECVEAAATRESAPMVRNLLGCFLFRGDDVHKSVGVLSGGERSRVALVCMLLHPANFLILDEPTNHLDLHAIEWLEEYLASFKGTVVAISHDRYFLDRTITRVIEILDGHAEFYNGNYSFYAVEKERRYLEKMRQYEKEQAKIRQLEAAADKLHLWAFMGNDALHKRAFSMEKRIERMRTTRKPTKARRLEARFQSREFKGDEVLQIKGISKSFGERRLFEDVYLRVEGGERIALLGENGTGKTTLSTDPKRLLIGDDEHGWDDNGVFNFEGGCYAKVINLDKESEPDIYNANKRNALLENDTLDAEGHIDFADKSVTENTRVSYPINHIQNIVRPVSSAPAAKNVIFLSADAFGVLPPVSILTPEQTQYYFLSGFTAKLAGTERGITEPTRRS